MWKKFLWLTVAACLAAYTGLVEAGETDVLVKKLVEKGILTPYEAQIVLDETKQEVATQNAKGTNESLPTWIQTTQLKGDLRLRYQTEQREQGTTRNRGRVRYRLGLESKPNDKFLVGAGLASSGKSGATTNDDPRSTNMTFENSSERSDVRLDYAWGEYKPNNALRMIGGKFNAQGKEYLWHTTDMLWDSDINQEGASVHGELSNVLGGDPFMNAGYFVLDESSSVAGDVGMYYGQAGTTFDLEPVKIRLAGGLYGVNGLDENHALLENRASGNTVLGQEYLYDFGRILTASAEMVYSWPEETSSPIKMAGVFGDYVMNPDPSSANTGYAAGLKFGHKKVSDKKMWQFKYQYVRLEKDAWLDAFPDSDRYSGNTNIKGHEFILDIGLAKNVSLGLDYYMSDVYKGTSKDESIFQADVNFKF